MDKNQLRQLTDPAIIKETEKKSLVDYVSTLEFYNSVPNLEQKETSEFLDVILKEVADLKSRIINQINKL